MVIIIGLDFIVLDIDRLQIEKICNGSIYRIDLDVFAIEFF